MIQAIRSQSGYPEESQFCVECPARIEYFRSVVDRVLQKDTLNLLFYNYTDLSTPEQGAKVNPIISTWNSDNGEIN